MDTDVSSHLSIGEVLSLLKEEFPDVTISKIRFLESQGLIDPERTPSGYRKFYEPDIDRLRWVLRQQRDHFLPLKVIKARLDEGVDFDEETTTQPNLFDEPAAPTSPSASPEAPSEARPRDGRAASEGGGPVGATEAEEGPDDEPERSEAADTDAVKDPAAWLTALQEGPDGARASTPPPTRPVEPLIDPEEVDSGVRYDTAGLAQAAGVDEELVIQLHRYGLVVAGRLGGEPSFDDSALTVVMAAAAFVSRGIEPRHLRAYKLAAEREAGLFEQLALPLLRQRNPQARQQAAELVGELSEQGELLRRALLRQALRVNVGGR